MDNKTRQALMTAANGVSMGWTRGAYHKEGRMCALGAMDAAEAAFFDTDNLSAHRLANAFRSYWGINFISEWNDAPERRKEEVVQAIIDVALFTP